MRTIAVSSSPITRTGLPCSTPSLQPARGVCSPLTATPGATTPVPHTPTPGATVETGIEVVDHVIEAVRTHDASALAGLATLLLCTSLLGMTGLFLRRTRTGFGVRATTQHRAAAAACGVDFRRADLVTYALGSALGAAAGAALSATFAEG